MKTYALLLCLFTFSLSAFAQQEIIGKPDYKKIKKSIQKKVVNFIIQY